jgi:signal transduction histidine kinase
MNRYSLLAIVLLAWAWLLGMGLYLADLHASGRQWVW